MRAPMPKLRTAGFQPALCFSHIRPLLVAKNAGWKPAVRSVGDGDDSSRPHV